jgi:cysteinyl-tRNA synthetase
MIHIYNYQTKKKEVFEPIAKDRFSMYICGVTPYDHAHLGHMVSALRFNTIRNYLLYRGYKGVFVQNITDIDDKIINRAKKEGVSHEEISKKFSKEYEDGLKLYNIKSADFTPKVTDYIDKIILYIQELIEGGYAYSTDKGNVYFDVSKKGDYGKLSNQNVADLMKGFRGVPDDESDKKNPVDFALWKSEQDDKYAWQSPWGLGRPGWHIECSVMSNDILGNHIDIHGGGLDLNFPHHENELAQCECHNSEPYVNFWMYSGLVQVDGVKMSKSLSNFITAVDASDRYTAELISYVVHTFHYRSHINFQDKIFTDSLNPLADVYRLFRNINNLYKLHSKDNTQDPPMISSENISNEFKNLSHLMEQSFQYAMDDDFNSPQAIVVLQENINHLQNKYDRYMSETSETSNSLVYDMFYMMNEIKRLAEVFGLFQRNPDKYLQDLLNLYYDRNNTKDDLRLDLNALSKKLADMQSARDEKQYDISDKLRDELLNIKISVVQKQGYIDWRFAAH